MSVKKVRVSELPQLQPDASGEGIFMPAADENNHTYRVPLSRYDNAKDEADVAAEVAKKAAEGAMVAAQEANAAAEGAMEAADRANNAADMANGIVSNKIANSGTTGAYSEYGQVRALRSAQRGRRGYPGGLIYDRGLGYTVDAVLEDSGDLAQMLYNACMSKGDIHVAFAGTYRNGWNGSGNSFYAGAAHVHYFEDVFTAIVTDLSTGDTQGQQWLYILGGGSGVWSKMGGSGSETADEALRVASEAQETASAAQTKADAVEASRAGEAKAGLAIGTSVTDTPSNILELAESVGFRSGRGFFFARILPPGTDIPTMIYQQGSRNDGRVLLVRLQGSYRRVPTSKGLINAEVLGFMAVINNYTVLFNYSSASNGIGTGVFTTMNGTEWVRIPIASLTSANLSSLDAVSSDTAPAVEAAEAGKEADDAE